MAHKVRIFEMRVVQSKYGAPQCRLQSGISEPRAPPLWDGKWAVSCSLIKTHLRSPWEAPVQPLPEDADWQKNVQPWDSYKGHAGDCECPFKRASVCHTYVVTKSKEIIKFNCIFTVWYFYWQVSHKTHHFRKQRFCVLLWKALKGSPGLHIPTQQSL